MQRTGADPKIIFGIWMMERKYGANDVEWRRVSTFALIEQAGPAYPALYLSNSLYDADGISRAPSGLPTWPASAASGLHGIRSTADIADPMHTLWQRFYRHNTFPIGSDEREGPPPTLLLPITRQAFPAICCQFAFLK